MSVESSTLDNYLNDYKAQDYKLDNYFTHEILNDGESSDWYKVIEENIAARHTMFLDECKIKVSLTDAQYRKYRCNAHRLAHDLYGQTELWFLILHANEMYSEMEMTSKDLYIYKPAQLIPKLTEISIVEGDYLKKNRNYVFSDETILKHYFSS